MPTNWKDYIVSDPEVLRGKPRLKGTRIHVSLVLGYLAAGKTAEEIIGEHPTSAASKSPPASTTRALWLNSRSASDASGVLGF